MSQVLMSTLRKMESIDRFYIRQEIEFIEILTGVEHINKYRIEDNLGNVLLLAKETSPFVQRQIIEPLREFQMALFTSDKITMAELSRPRRCLCHQEMTIKSVPPDNILEPSGPVLAEQPKIKQKRSTDSLMKSTIIQINALSKQPSLSVIGMDSIAKYQNFTKIVQRKCWSRLVFDIVDFEGNKLLTVEGPGACNTFLNSVTMEIKTANGEVIGKITNEWSGALQETITDADNFCVCCPAELDLGCKVALLGAAFLFDYLFFER